jgi:hypothetical protein
MDGQIFVPQDSVSSAMPANLDSDGQTGNLSDSSNKEKQAQNVSIQTQLMKQRLSNQLGYGSLGLGEQPATPQPSVMWT